jgi:hypothetical protein
MEMHLNYFIQFFNIFIDLCNYDRYLNHHLGAYFATIFGLKELNLSSYYLEVSAP